MPYTKRELTSEDLQAFDLLLGYLQDIGHQSINLLDFMAGGPNDAQRAYDAAKEANKQRDDLKDRVNDATAILERLFEGINPDNITLGQLSREVSLQKLIEIRRSLER